MRRHQKLLQSSKLLLSFTRREQFGSSLYVNQRPCQQAASPPYLACRGGCILRNQFGNVCICMQIAVSCEALKYHSMDTYLSNRGNELMLNLTCCSQSAVKMGIHQHRLLMESCCGRHNKDDVGDIVIEIGVSCVQEFRFNCTRDQFSLHLQVRRSDSIDHDYLSAFICTARHCFLTAILLQDNSATRLRIAFFARPQR